MQKDALLVKQTLAGEHEAFHHLIILHQADIYAIILSWIKNPDDAKELVQDVFLEAYRDLGSLRNPERFRFWLRQIARYHCQSWLERKREFVPLNDDIVAETPSADETLILRETLAKVMQAIDELPETEKQIIKERYLDESSYGELQARHGLSYKALSMRLLRAKQKVRKLLAGIGILSWQDALRKMLSGGVEAVKISAKVKITAIGIGIILIIGGGVFINFLKLDHQYSQKNIFVSDQTKQEISDNTRKSDQRISINKPRLIQGQQKQAQFNKVSKESKMPNEEEKKDMKPKVASETEQSKAGNSPTGISPELEKMLVTFKEYADKKLANTQEYAPLTEQFGVLVRRENELSDALEKASGEEFYAVLAEFSRVTKERTEVGRAMAPYEQRAEQMDREYDEYFQTHYGITVQQFKEAHTDDIKNWWAKNQFPKYWTDD